MRMSPSFESQSSFEEFGSSTLDETASIEGTEEVPLETDWGVVSTTGSDVGTTGTSSEHIGNGVLIVDGEESGKSRNEHSSAFSVPDTESLPSDIGSLSAENNNEGNPMSTSENAWVISKRVVYIYAFAAFFVFSAVTGLFIRQHYSYRSTVQELGQKIEQLEKEREEKPQMPWMDEDDAGQESSLLTLLDNCWIKAKMNIQFGDCSQNSYGLCGAFFENATQTIGRWFNETFASPIGNEQQQKNLNDDKDYKEAVEKLAAFPGFMGEAIVSASKTVSEKIFNFGANGGDDVTDDLDRASEAFSEALQSAGGVMASELNDLGEDPIKYMTEAFEEVSKPARSTKFSMDGIRTVVDKVSSASIGWGDALAQTSETISVKVAEMMDDPLAYFEYETKTSREKDL